MSLIQASSFLSSVVAIAKVLLRADDDGLCTFFFILLAAASNNILKGSYTLAFAGRQVGLKPALALFLLAAGGVLSVLFMLGRL